MGPTHNVVHEVNINLPRFDGENNRGRIWWIKKTEKYFEKYNIYGDEDKLNVVAMYMDKLVVTGSCGGTQQWREED